MLLNIIEAAGVFAADQAIKNRIESADGGTESRGTGVNGRSGHFSRSYCNGRVNITDYHNYGFAGNMSSDRPAFVKMMSVILTITVTIFFICTLASHGNKMLKTALSLMLGAAFSNTYDRLKKGYVVDYFSVNAGPKAFRQLVWNLADFALIIGALLTVIG